MVISMERGADLHMAQLMPLPLTVSCFSEIQIGFTFLVLAHPGSPGKKAVKRVCVCVCVCVCSFLSVTVAELSTFKNSPAFWHRVVSGASEQSEQGRRLLPQVLGRWSSAPL